jgi:hypothetical protein
MSYKEFTLDKLSKTFGIQIQGNLDIFSTFKQTLQLEDFFVQYLEYNIALALAINTEKARSEMIIAPILIELKRLLNSRISLFSGTEFNVDSDRGLNGFCDFLISLSDQQLYISSPVLIIFEAKNENIKGGLGQCIAAMLAAKIFNEKEGHPIEQIYGAVTTGNQWKFIKLENDIAYVDSQDYYIDRIENIMGILAKMTALRELRLSNWLSVWLLNLIVGFWSLTLIRRPMRQLH